MKDDLDITVTNDRVKLSKQVAQTVFEGTVEDAQKNVDEIIAAIDFNQRNFDKVDANLKAALKDAQDFVQVVTDNAGPALVTIAEEVVPE